VHEASLQVNILQRLRSSPQPLQGWESDGSTFETEGPLEFVDTEASCMPFLLQHTKRYQAAHDMMPLSLFRARLTACQAQLIFAHSDDFLDVIVATHQTVDLVVHTPVYKLRREMQPGSHS
jgi:hypothetical protein